MLIVKYVVTAILVLSVAHNVGSGYNGGRDKVAQDRNDWAERNYAAVLETLLPSGAVTPEKFPENIKWMVTVRILPPHENPEYRFSFHRTYDGRVAASVTAAKGTSIISQLRRLNSKYSDVAPQKISEMISIERRTITQAECPRLRQLASQFEAIHISPVLPDELRMDETGYEFWSQSLYGNRMNVLLGGPGSDAKRQPHPLLQWAEDVRKTLSRLCSASANH